MTRRDLFLILAFVFFTTSCGDELQSPSDAFLIPKEQVASVVKDADGGDIVAIRRLIAHYEASSEGNAVAEKWRAKARALDDAQELYYHAARSLSAARTESDLAKRQEMLLDALSSAKSSYASSADPSTQRLIDEIVQALSGHQQP